MKSILDYSGIWENPINGLLNNWCIGNDDLQPKSGDTSNQDAAGMALTRRSIGSGSLGPSHNVMI